MLTAYYSYSESRITVFDNKKISEINGWDKYLGEFNVIQLDMLDYFNNNNYSVDDGIKQIKNSIIFEVKNSLEEFEYDDNESIFLIIKKLFKYTE
eukprot:jgi/Orpsp1_1/1180960/evm.model.c7180000075258.1